MNADENNDYISANMHKKYFDIVQNNLITRTLVNFDTKNRSTLFNMFNEIFFAHLDFKICKLIVIFLTVCREINTQRFNTDVCLYFIGRESPRTRPRAAVKTISNLKVSIRTKYTIPTETNRKAK